MEMRREEEEGEEVEGREGARVKVGRGVVDTLRLGEARVCRIRVGVRGVGVARMSSADSEGQREEEDAVEGVVRVVSSEIALKERERAVEEWE